MPVIQNEKTQYKPCVGCGYCCTKAPCGLAMAFFPKWTSPCPALTHHHGRHWCRFIEEAQDQQRIDLMKELAINIGCCSPMFNTVRDAQIARKHK